MARITLFAAAAAVAAALSPVAAPAADHVAVEAMRQGTAVAIHAQASLHASFDVIWQTLTDYEHLAQFIPRMATSRLIGRHGNVAIVEQSGSAAFLFFRYPVHVIYESEEQHPFAIRARLLSGSLKRFDGGYRIESIEGRSDYYALRWTGVIEGDAPLPVFVAVRVTRANVQEQFLAMVREIERRERARPPSG